MKALSSLILLTLAGRTAMADPTSHAESDAFMAEAAALAEPFIVDARAIAVEPAQCNQLGQWSSVIPWTPHIPVTAANLPDGRILTFASNQRTSFPSGVEFTYAATWDPATGQFLEFNHPSHDMFCGGISHLPDGRIMVNGGRNETVRASIFDWRNNTWTRIPDMSGGRWYNSSVATPDGGVWTATGSGTGMHTSEKWNGTSWVQLTGIDWTNNVLNQPGYVTHWHPFVSMAPDGRIMHFGPTDRMHYITHTGTGALAHAGATVPGAHYPKEGCYAMYDAGKVLVMGGSANTTPNPSDSSTGTSTNLCYTVDMNTTPPTVVNTASMANARQFANAVVLPSGEVIVMGGNTSGLKFNDAGSVLPCEIWNPRTGLWRTVASIAVPRNYHSVALLLPDGRVWLGGGGLAGNSPADHRDAQIYTPPCLFTSSGALATRPVLTAAPTAIGPGQTFSVTGTAGLAKFAFVKMSSVTHSVNTDQRYLSLPFIETSAGNYSITAHSNLNVMTPGYWMLFGIAPEGPHSVARIIRVDATSAIHVANPGPQITNINTPVSLQINATGPVGVTLTYSAIGLPTGLVINSATGRITGTPNVSGLFNPRVTVSGGGLSGSQDFSWSVLLTNTGSGTILREWWLNIPGVTLADLTNHPSYPSSPNGTDQRTSFETPTNWADNMGQRMRGTVHPPVTGQYRFWIAGDDESRLLLSTNNTSANATIIARVPTWTNSREWGKFPEQQSGLITLQAGQVYYIEALMKEGGGGDNLAVGWQMPGNPNIEVIPGAYLSPFQPNRAPVLTNPGNRTHVVNLPLTLNVQASDPDGDSLTFSATGLPAGLSINSSTGVISGTPTATGTSNVTVSVTDNRSPAVTASFSWTINNPVTVSLAGAPPAALGTTQTFTAQSSGGANVRFKWNFGNGVETGFSASNTATHTYAAPGRYLVTVTATDDTGRVVTATFYQAIHAALTARKPTNSSSIVFEDRAAANDRVWCVNHDNDSVSVFDAVTRTRSAEINVGTAPRTLAIAPDGRVWVVNAVSASISIVDHSTLTVVATVNLPRGSRPFGIAFDPDGSDAWVACENSGQLLRLHPSTGAQTGSLNVGLHARHVSVNADSSRVLVSRFVTPPLPGEETATVQTEIGPTKFGGEVVAVNASALTIERTIVLQHSEAPDTPNSGRGIPNYLGPAVISPDGQSAWVASKQDNIKRGMLRNGQALTHESSVRCISSRIALNAGTPATDDLPSRIDHDNAGAPSTTAFDATGIYLFTAIEATREVAITDAWAKDELLRFVAGRAPQGLALSPDNRTVYVHNFMDRTITVHDISGIIDGRETAPTLVATLNTITTERLTATVLLGKKHFYDAQDTRIALQGYISCASCHNDGGHDGRTWDFTQFGEGLRNTITLRGHGGMAQGPLHWTGNFDEVQDFENQIRGLGGGTGLITAGSPHPPLGTANAGRSADLDALAAYVSSLTSNERSPDRNPDGSLTVAAAAGKTVFQAKACAECHSGAQFSNSALNVFRNIGTIKSTSGQRLGAALTGLDTPTLRGLAVTAPYLHDGSAPTLEAAISAHQGISLTANERANLVAYLRQIEDTDPTAGTAPSTTLSTGSSTVTANFNVSVTFSAPVTGLAAGDFEITNGTAGTLSGSGASYTLVVAPSATGVVTVRLPLNAAQSAEGNANVASNTLSVNYNQPNRPPVVTTPPPQSTVRGTAASLQIQASDPDGNTLTYSASGLPQGLAINATTGLISGTVSLSAANSNSVTVAVNDGQATTTTSFAWATTDPAAVVPAALDHWKLDESTGPTAANAARAIHGTHIGGVRTGEGGATSNLGNSAFYDGVDDATSIPPLNYNTTTLTICSWVRRDGQMNPWSPIFYSRSANTEVGLNIGDDNELRYLWNGGHWRWAPSPALTLPNNQWVLAALVVTPTTATLYLRDGTGLKSATNTTTHFNSPFEGTSYIGWDPARTTRFFRGWIDEVRIWKTALTSAQIESIYQQGISGSTNRPPAITQPPAQTTSRGSVASLQIQATDPDGNPLNYSATGLPLGLSIQPTTGLISGTVSTGAAASNNVTVTVSDGSLTASASFAWNTTAPGATIPVAVDHWRFDETGGTLAINAVRSLDGVHQAGAVPNQPGATSSLGRSVFYDGVDDITRVPALGYTGNTRSFALWVRRSGNQAPYTKFLSAVGPLVDVAFGVGEDNELRYRWAWTHYQWEPSPPLTLPDNQWVLAALSVEPTGATMFLRTAAGLQSARLNATQGNQTFSSDFVIGADASRAGRFFRGWIDDVRVFSRAIDSSDVEALWNAAQSGSANRAPTVSRPADQSTPRASTASLQIQANDPDGDALTYSAVGLPLGLAINASTGLISGTVSTSAAAANNVTITVSDGLLTASTSFAWATTAPAGVPSPDEWWKLDETSGTTAVNSIRNLPGTHLGGALINQAGASAQTGRSVYFDGIDDATSFPALNNSSRSMSILVWLKRDGPQAPRAQFFFCRDGATDAGFGLGDDHALRYHWQGGYWNFTGSPQIILPDAQWCLAALVVRPDSGTLMLRTNSGIQSVTNFAPHLLQTFGSVSNLASDPSREGRRFKGWMDELLIYRRALSLDEVEAVWLAGQGGQRSNGLTGTYFNGTNFETQVLQRLDSAVNFNWGTGSPATGINVDNFSARWTGCIVPQFSQSHTFYLLATTGCRLYVNEQLVINNWTNPVSTEVSGTLNLTANEPVPIRVEYYAGTGNARCELSWSSASLAKQIIPQSRLLMNETSLGGGPIVITADDDRRAFQISASVARAIADLPNIQRSFVLEPDEFGTVTFGYNRLAGLDESFHLQASADLVNWFPVPRSAMLVLPDGNGVSESILVPNAQYLLGDQPRPKIFFRVKAGR